MDDDLIKHNTSCHDDYDSSSMAVTAALDLINKTIQPIDGFEQLSIRLAVGRMLDEDILAPLNVPDYDNSAMDGYAIQHQDLLGKTTLAFKIVGSSLAGHPYEDVLKPGEAVRIMTGAIIPVGTDTVVMQEHVQLSDGSIVIQGEYSSGQNVRKVGEDIQQGSQLFLKGKRLMPADIGILASLGIAEVKVKRLVQIAFFSTGDELCAIGATRTKGQIFDSNRYTLFGMLSRLGVNIIDMGSIPDNVNAIKSALITASNTADAVITTGGVSVGDADYVKDILKEIGKINFWKIAMKPGRPLAFGQINNAIFFGLPGNPVSAMVTFYQYIQPAIKRMMGQNETSYPTFKVECVSLLKKKPGRTEFQRGILFKDQVSGQYKVKSTGMQDSHMLSSMSQANCFIVLPTKVGSIAPGTLVDVQPFDAII